ncbi:Unknown protein, partial [Striga hermonthica]
IIQIIHKRTGRHSSNRSSSSSDHLEPSVGESDCSNRLGTILDSNRDFWTKLNHSGASWTRLDRSNLALGLLAAIWAHSGQAGLAWMLLGLFKSRWAAPTTSWAVVMLQLGRAQGSWATRKDIWAKDSSGKKKMSPIWARRRIEPATSHGEDSAARHCATQ